MRWRVWVEMTGADGSVNKALLGTGERAGFGPGAVKLGPTLTDDRATFAALLSLIGEAQAANHCAFRG